MFRYFRGFRTKDLWEFYRIWNHRLVFLLIGPTKPITGGKGVWMKHMCDGSEEGVKVTFLRVGVVNLISLSLSHTWNRKLLRCIVLSRWWTGPWRGDGITSLSEHLLYAEERLHCNGYPRLIHLQLGGRSCSSLDSRRVSLLMRCVVLFSKLTSIRSLVLLLPQHCFTALPSQLITSFLPYLFFLLLHHSSFQIHATWLSWSHPLLEGTF
jgi:hypothetical protein